MPYYISCGAWLTCQPCVSLPCPVAWKKRRLFQAPRQKKGHTPWFDPFFLDSFDFWHILPCFLSVITVTDGRAHGSHPWGSRVRSPSSPPHWHGNSDGNYRAFLFSIYVIEFTCHPSNYFAYPGNTTERMQLYHEKHSWSYLCLWWMRKLFSSVIIKNVRSVPGMCSYPLWQSELLSCVRKRKMWEMSVGWQPQPICSFIDG